MPTCEPNAARRRLMSPGPCVVVQGNQRQVLPYTSWVRHDAAMNRAADNAARALGHPVPIKRREIRE